MRASEEESPKNYRHCPICDQRDVVSVKAGLGQEKCLLRSWFLQAGSRLQYQLICVTSVAANSGSAGLLSVLSCLGVTAITYVMLHAV